MIHETTQVDQSITLLKSIIHFPADFVLIIFIHNPSS